MSSTAAFGSSTCSRTPWQSRTSAAAGPTTAEQGTGVPLLGAHPVGDAGVRGTALQRGESVGAGVDDGDAVAEARERDRETPGATADVDDVERAARARRRAPRPGGRGPPRPRRCARRDGARCGTPSGGTHRRARPVSQRGRGGGTDPPTVARTRRRGPVASRRSPRCPPFRRSSWTRAGPHRPELPGLACQSLRGGFPRPSLRAASWRAASRLAAASRRADSRWSARS